MRGTVRMLAMVRCLPYWPERNAGSEALHNPHALGSWGRAVSARAVGSHATPSLAESIAWHAPVMGAGGYDEDAECDAGFTLSVGVDDLSWLD